MANINFIMQECSMPFEMPLGDFVSQALETNEDVFGALLKKRTKAGILTYLNSNSVTLSDLKELLEDILERLNKPHELIKDVNRKSGAISLIENGIDLIPPQVKITKEEGQETEEAQENLVPLTKMDLQRLYETLQNSSKCKLVDDGSIQISDSPQIVESLPVGIQEDFCLESEAYSFYFGAVALIGGNGEMGEVVAAGHLERNGDNEIHFVFPAEDIDYDFFRSQTQCQALLFPQEAAAVLKQKPLVPEKVAAAYLVTCYVYFQELEETERTLCIDFGTSNTTVGSYGVNTADDSIEIVRFVDQSSGHPVERRMVPTMVYVQKIEENKVNYLFGYEALQAVKAKDYCTTATVFYEIKRWINDLDSVEEIYDEEGRRGKVRHKDIIKAYLDFVIHTAEEKFFKKRFKRIHFTAPVKLKDSFINAMKDLFKEKTVLRSSSSLDEGIAIVYQFIANKLNNRESGQGLPIMISDCGGGTTDLARCDYTIIQDTGTCPRLEITTSFENGDSNFGGNNLTFRILQMLKIKMASYHYTQKDISMKELVMDENSILNLIDEERKKGWEKIYEKVEDSYKKSEALIPTLFAKEKMRTDKLYVKRNFYYLWQMAEAYKKSFYQTQKDRVSLNFDDEKDLELGIGTQEMYYLYFRNTEGKLEKKERPLEGLRITITDIERLLYADIYYLWTRVLPIDEMEKETYNFNYRLSGQSCKIDLFAQLLKEFIPGRCLRGKGDKRNDDEQLKLDCLEGSIRYNMDKDEGRFEPVIHSLTPKLLYDLLLVRKDAAHPQAEDVSLLHREDNGRIQLKVASFPTTASRSLFQVRKREEPDEIVNTFDFEFNREKTPQITYDNLFSLIRDDVSEDYYEEIVKALRSQLGCSRQDLERHEAYYVFAVPSKEGYGVYLFQVKCINEPNSQELYLQKDPCYYSFESDSLMTFFDGKR